MKYNSIKPLAAGAILTFIGGVLAQLAKADDQRHLLVEPCQLFLTSVHAWRGTPYDRYLELTFASTLPQSQIGEVGFRHNAEFVTTLNASLSYRNANIRLQNDTEGLFTLTVPVTGENFTATYTGAFYIKSKDGVMHWLQDQPFRNVTLGGALHNFIIYQLAGGYPEAIVESFECPMLAELNPDNCRL